MRILLPVLAWLTVVGLAPAQMDCGLNGVTVTVSPQNPALGETVTVTLHNDSGLGLLIPSGCIYDQISAGGTCSGPTVQGPNCGALLQFLPNGDSTSKTWDQRDDFGQLVPSGIYAFHVRYTDGNGDPQSCCVPVTIGSVGTPFCFGDGSGTLCPCGNAGASDAGCANGQFSSGARMTASGTASVSADDIVLAVEASKPNQPGLFFQGDNAIAGGNGVAFGDGLRCAGGSVVRLQVRTASNAGEATTSIPIGTTGGVSPGDTRRYQWWYRDPLTTPCGTGFNLSNGIEATWTP